MAVFSYKDIIELERLCKINLINSISGFKPANLIGTVSSEGIENLAVFSSLVHLGSAPPVLSFILRPTTVPRNTYKNIKETGYYTINSITEDFVEEAHHTSAKYPEEISEFEVTGLKPIYINDFKAPFVAKSPIKIGMKFLEELHIKTNDVIMIIGQVETLHIEDNLLQEDGFVDLTKGNIASVNGLDAYAVPKSKKRFEYQRPRKID